MITIAAVVVLFVVMGILGAFVGAQAEKQWQKNKPALLVELTNSINSGDYSTALNKISSSGSYAQDDPDVLRLKAKATELKLAHELSEAKTKIPTLEGDAKWRAVRAARANFPNDKDLAPYYLELAKIEEAEAARLKAERAEKEKVEKEKQRKSALEHLVKLVDEPVPDSREGIIIEAAFYQVYADYADESSFRKKLAQVQANRFPKLRKQFGEITNKKLWIEDGAAEVKGTGNRTITLIHGSFAANRNIAEMQQSLSEILRSLRFTRSEYKWYKEVEKYTYYNLKEVPSDSEIGKWDDSGAWAPIN